MDLVALVVDRWHPVGSEKAGRRAVLLARWIERKLDTRRYPKTGSGRKDHEERESKDRANKYTMTRSTIPADVGVAIVPCK
ncbi:hypothetical protein TNCV_10751 [Trichonephila clavipes]|nr:hypothetical protein TNCV_10751 [Trichonephila clavipes]